METKKSAIDLTDLALGIVVLGIVVTIGATLMINMRDARLTDLPVTTTTNETVGDFGSVSSATLDNTWVKAITTVHNASGSVIDATNYTLSVNSATGVGTISNTSNYYPYSWNVTYTTYDTTQPEWALADDAATGLAEYGNWFKIIVIVGVAAVILGLIFLAFGRGAGTVQSSNY